MEKAALRFSSIQMPALVQRGTNFWLSCQFDLAHGVDQLYSVKWYKNNEEFYRLLVSNSNWNSGEQQHFSVPGVNVMVSSGECGPPPIEGSTRDKHNCSLQSLE